MAEWESPSLYRARRAYLEEQRRQRAQQLPVPVPYQPEPPPEPTPPPGIIQAPLQALERLTRPGAAVRGFLGSPDDRMAGALAGLRGEEVPSGYQLGRFTPNQPNIGPLPFSGADVAGRAIELATDPLLYAPGVGWGAKGLTFSRGPILSAITALPKAAGLLRQSGSRGLEAAGALAPAVTVAKQMAANVQRTPGRSLPSLPVIGNLLSPRLRDQDETIQAIVHAYDAALTSKPEWAERAVLPLRITKVDPSEPIAEVIEGTKSLADLSARGRQALPFIQKRIAEAEELWDATRAKLISAYGPTSRIAKKYELERLPNYAPRYMESTDETGQRIFAAIGSRRGLEFERSFATKEAGEAAGFSYVDDVTALRLHMRDVGAKVSEMEMLAKLQPYKKYVEDDVHAALSAARSETGLREIPGTTFHGLWFDPADAKALGSYLGREDAWKKSLGTLGQRVAEGPRLVRGIQASADLSFSFLQNLPNLARDPGRGLAVIAQGIRAFLDPGKLDELLDSEIGRRVLAELPGLPVGAGSSEYLEAGGRIAELAAKAPLGAGRVLGPIARQTIGRSQVAWDAASSAARIYWGDAMLGAVRRAGTPEAAGQAVDFLTHATGGINRQAMGMSPKQRALEDFLLFAPGFLRGSLALGGDLLHGQVAREEAMKTISSMMIAGAWYYQHIADAMPDQEPIWDSADARFMTVDVLGNRVGIGGPYRSLANMLGKIAAHPEELGDWAGLDPENRNPILRFWRGRTSVPISRAWDLISGETYIGQPLGSSIGDITIYAGTALLPFSVAGYITEHGPLPEKLGRPDVYARGVATGTGLRAYPEGFNDLADRLSRTQFGKGYRELGPIEQARIRESPEVKALPVTEGRAGERGRQIGDIQTEWKTQVESAAADVRAGTISPSLFRERAGEATKVRRILMSRVEEPRRPGLKSERDQQVDTYFNLLERVGADGRPNYDLAEAYRDSIPGLEAELEQRQLAGYEKLEPEARALMQELAGARKLLEPYRELTRKRLERVGIWDQYVTSTPVEQDMLEKTPRYRMAERLADRDRKLLRRREPAVDGALVRWYGLVPIRQQR